MVMAQGGPTDFEMTRGTAPLSTFVLKLYVTGASPRTERAIANLRQICDSELAGRYTLAIVDVLEDPEAAERDRILATPTLIKEFPVPLRRIIGDLSDHAKVLLALEVRPRGLHVSPELTIPLSLPSGSRQAPSS